jgi:AraC-like DNA-binding protein
MAMTQDPDRLSGRPAVCAPFDPLDVAADVLQAVKLSGAMLFLVEARTPWRTQAPAASAFAKAIMPSARHLVSYHVVTRGACWAGLVDDEPLRLAAGDVLVVPHGDAYYLAEPAGAAPCYSDADATRFFRQMAAGKLPSIVNEGGDGAASAEFLCGFLGCDQRPFDSIGLPLPRVLCVRAGGAAADRLSHLIAYAVAELRRPVAGSREVLLRLSELMFIEVLRRHLAVADVRAPGWLAGLRDPLIARALSSLHREPAHPWTLEALAAASGGSRSTLAERFLRLVGRPPMHYLGAWRMQLAARLLSDRSAKVRAVAEAVGYASEASFSRAFKQHFGAAPGSWRGRRRRSDAGSRARGGAP